MTQFIEQLGLSRINGLFQDWGGLIGMRVVEKMPDRFARIVVANTMLIDTTDIPQETAQMLEDVYATMSMPSAYDVKTAFDRDDPLAGAMWVKYATENPQFTVSDVFKIITGKEDEAVLRGYAAPFPNDTYLAGPRSFPQLFPIMMRHQADREENNRVWANLSKLPHPVLAAFSDGDPVTRGHDRKFRERMPGARGVEHVTINNAGHYLQDEQPEDLSRAVIRFISDST